MTCDKCNGSGKLPNKDFYVSYYDYKLDKNVRTLLSQVSDYHWERANQIAESLKKPISPSAWTGLRSLDCVLK